MSLSTNNIICPHCNNQLPHDSKFCQYCGIKIESTTFNVDNHIQTLESNKYCPSCDEIHTNFSNEDAKPHKRIKTSHKNTIILIIVSTAFLISLTMNVILAYLATDYKQHVNELELENSHYYNYWVDSFEKIDFVDEFIVFVEDDGTNLYHKYECFKFKDNSFWAFNVEAAIYEGYTACPYCH